jgi:hypothetical protein
MPVEDPRGSAQDVPLHSFDVHLEDGDLPVNDVIEPSDLKCLVDREGHVHVTVEADLVLLRQVVRSHASGSTESDLVNSYLAAQTVGGHVAAQNINVSGHGFDGMHERGRAQRTEPNGGCAQVCPYVDVDTMASQQTDVLEELLLVPATAQGGPVNPGGHLERTVVEDQFDPVPSRGEHASTRYP